MTVSVFPGCWLNNDVFPSRLRHDGPGRAVTAGPPGPPPVGWTPDSERDSEGRASESPVPAAVNQFTSQPADHSVRRRAPF